ncbi:MAG: flavodoxin family protein [Eubacteriales bacterium]|nr:flavodoxin family protein [Eubacteriales bacterium]
MIVIISGSPRGERSTSTKTAIQIADLLGLPYRVYDASAWHIDYCTACDKCVQYGRCTLESEDDFPEILRDLRNAEGLIFASPVYCGNYTAQLKTFIDRIPTELHAMTLLGKPSVVLAVSNSSYEERTANSLAELLEYAGSEVVDTLCINRKTHSETIRQMCRQAALRLREALSDDHIPVLTDRTKSWYKQQSAKYRVLLKFADFYPYAMGEARLWQDQGYFECATAEEAARMRRKAVPVQGISPTTE